MKNILILILALVTTNAFAWEMDTITVGGGLIRNTHDTHTYWDGTYMWIPESDYYSQCNGTAEINPAPLPVVHPDSWIRSKQYFSQNIIRVNPATNPPTFDIYTIDNGTTAKGEDNFMMYEIMPSIKYPNRLYVCAPYTNTEALVWFDKSTLPASSGAIATRTVYYTDKLFEGVNGAKMAITVDDDVEWVWGTGVGYTLGSGVWLAKYDPLNSVETSWDVSQYPVDVSPSWHAQYGISAVPNTSGNSAYMVYTTDNKGNLRSFPSDMVNMSDNNIDYVSVATVIGVADAKISAMSFNGTHLWIAMKSDALEKYAFIRYTPSFNEDSMNKDAGSFTVYLVNDATYVTCVLPTMYDFDGNMWLTVEEDPILSLHNPDDLEAGVDRYPQLLVLDKSTGKTESILLTGMYANDRAAASFGYTQFGAEKFVYTMGYGYSDKGRIMQMEQIVPQSLDKYVSFSGVTLSGFSIQ